MTHLTLVFLLACLSPLPVHGGWGTSKGQGGRCRHQWHSHGNGYGSRYGGKGSFASPHTHRADAMAFVVEALQQSSRGRRRSRSTSRTRSRSSSKRGRRSSSSSTAMQQELLELRKYRQEAEAAAAAAREEAKKQEEREAREAEFKKLEERLLKAIPTPVKSGQPSQRPLAGQAAKGDPPITPVVARFIETLADQNVSSEGLCSWELVEQRLLSLEANVLRQLLANHSLDIPRQKGKRVEKIVEFLVQQCSP